MDNTVVQNMLFMCMYTRAGLNKVCQMVFGCKYELLAETLRQLSKSSQKYKVRCFHGPHTSENYVLHISFRFYLIVGISEI